MSTGADLTFYYVVSTITFLSSRLIRKADVLVFTLFRYISLGDSPPLFGALSPG